ncbi:MAG TPA: class II fumarate hydratase [Pseudomonadales bacterium]|nr:class II fumarate hydratase [Pseudomonadales bacterium]
MKTRKETDSMGSIDVPDAALWGAQTQRSLQNFRIGLQLSGAQQFPLAFIHTFAQVKKAAALANQELDKLPHDLCALIVQACDEIILGQHNDQFPLVIWQTGSGTQTNMNLNEVIANRANELVGKSRGEKSPVHPNDHVNMSQSSNDVFPTVMHITMAQAVQQQLLPAIDYLLNVLTQKIQEFFDSIKSGRTHMMDATPVTLGQEFSGYQQQISYAREQIVAGLQGVLVLAIGGSAVGTGLNTPPCWAETITKYISKSVGIDFFSADNKFMALAGHEALTDLHSRVRLLATALFKIANDLRLMGSGPRCGLAEIYLPENEPGSSIMPGKVNPTQIEALTMVAIQVMGNDTAVGFANSQGQFELNVYKPLIFRNVFESITLLADVINSFTEHCVQGIRVNEEKIAYYIEQSLMLVTALTPVIGYDKAAQSAKLAHEKNLSLKQAVLQLGLMSAEAFDTAVKPELMLQPPQQ